MFRDPGRLAWTVLLISFALFCLLSSMLFLGVRWFLFDSSVPLETSLFASRNTVSIRENTADAGFQAVRSSMVLTRESQLMTDSASQGLVTFVDPYSHETVATITLHHDGEMRIGDATRPRFDFSTNGYVITVQAGDSNLDVDIVPNQHRPVTLDIQSPRGDILITEPGRYTVASRGDGFSIFNRSGVAFVLNQKREARSVPGGMEGAIDPQTDAILIKQTLIDIIPDGGFDTVNPVNEALSTEWGCYVLRDDPNSALGEVKRETVNGRPVMHITRAGSPGQDATNHAENGCQQWLNTRSVPLSIAAYDYLELRATMQIRDRPFMLNACGQLGSECPVMIEINYIDPYGQKQRWIHGFYTRYDPAVGWPLRCDTCSQDHEQINRDTWYTYSSGNLLQLLPPDQRPVAIDSVRFYASGHEYDVLLSEVALLAGLTTPVFTEEPTTETITPSPQSTATGTPAVTPSATPTTQIAPPATRPIPTATHTRRASSPSNTPGRVVRTPTPARN